MIQVLEGDALTQLATLPAESVHCVVTSPPYLGLAIVWRRCWHARFGADT